MQKTMFSSILLALIFFAFSFVSAQEVKDTNAGFSKEIHLGMGIARQLRIPRIMYKKVKEKSATRFTLRLGTGTELIIDNRELSQDFYDNTTKRINAYIDVGIGKEKRVPLGQKFQFFYGGTIRAFYGMNRSKTERVTERDQVVVAQTATNRYDGPGAALDVFAGVRFDPHPRIIFTMEAGPTVSGTFNYSKTSSTTINNVGPNQSVDRIDNGYYSFTGDLDLFSPIFLQLGLLF